MAPHVLDGVVMDFTSSHEIRLVAPHAECGSQARGSHPAGSQNYSAMNEKRHVLVDLASGRSRPAMDKVPALSTADGPWTEILIEHHRGGGHYENNGLANPDHMVIVQQQRPVIVEWGTDGHSRLVTLQPGQSAFIPAMLPHFVRSKDIGEFVAMSINPLAVRRIAHEVVADPGNIEWQAALPLDEELLSSIVKALLDEAVRGYQSGVGYAEALTHALAAHLLRRFARNRQVLRERSRGLGRSQLRRALEYIQGNLGADSTLTAIAREAGLSRFHFARMFKQSTGVSPHQYVLQCRLEKARTLLLEEELTIAQIAAQTGFYDQSHLVGQFKRAFGVTPSQFRRSQS